MGWDAGGCHCPDNTYWLLVAACGETCHKCRNWDCFEISMGVGYRDDHPICANHLCLGGFPLCMFCAFRGYGTPVVRSKIVLCFPEPAKAGRPAVPANKT